MSALPTKEQRYQYFALDFGGYVRNWGRSGVVDARKEEAKESNQYHSGRLLTFYEILILMTELAMIYEIPLNTLNLHDIDPEKELFVGSKELAIKGGVEQLWNQESQETADWIKTLKGYGVPKAQKGKTYTLYLQTLGSLFRERAFELKAEKRRVYSRGINSAESRFKAGQLLAYRAVMYDMQNFGQIGFQIHPKEISLLGLDTDKDL